MVSPLSWNVGFAIGHPEIDAQHRHLILVINEIIAAVEQKAVEKLPAMLSALGTAAAEHFQQEISTLRELLSDTHHAMKGRRTTPRLVKSLAEVRIDEHQAQHDALLDRLNGFAVLPPHTMCGQLKDWFVDHAIKQDSRLRAVFQAI